MKKLYSIITVILFAVILQAQTPQKMSYQAVIRNSSNVLLTNTQVGMQISILKGSESGTAVYVETQRPTTNANGLVSVEIGAGEVESGSFADIDWQNGPYFIKTETDPDGGTSYSITGTSQILSVPFALHAQTAESANETDPEFNAWDKSSGINIDKEQVNGLDDYIETEIDPVFEQSAASGITETDTENWDNKLDEESDPIFEQSVASNITETDTENWNNKLDEESDPVFGASPASSITEADKERWDSQEEFSGSYADLTDKPENLGDFTNDVGYQLRSEDEDTSPTNEIQHLSARSNHTIGLSGSSRFVDIPSLETDPKYNSSVASGITAADTTKWNNSLSSYTETDPEFTVWNKSTGISITESQISDLDHFTNADETDQVYATDSSFIKTSTRSWNSSLAKKITESDTSYWGRVETDPYYSADSFFIKTGVRSWNSSLAKDINSADTTRWGAAETDRIYSADSAYIKSSARSWNSSISKGIVGSDTASWNDKTYISDIDGDTKIETEQTPDEDIIRMHVAGDEVFNVDDTGFEFILPTNDATSNIKVLKNNGTAVFGVDGRGMMYGDGSGLSNVKPLANFVGGNQRHQVLSNYGSYDNVRNVTLNVPSSGICYAIASGYTDWESTGWDLYLGAILMDQDPNSSWAAENEWYSYLNIITDYNCADSSDQYTSFAQHRCFNVGPGIHNFYLWVNKYSSASKTELGDVNLSVLFFPTAGTGSGPLNSTQLEANNELQEPSVPFTSVPRGPNGDELRKRLDAMMSEERKPEKIPDDELIELQKTIDDLKADNESLKQEKRETDKRISEIENQIKQLLITN